MRTRAANYSTGEGITWHFRSVLDCPTTRRCLLRSQPGTTNRHAGIFQLPVRWEVLAARFVLL